LEAKLTILLGKKNYVCKIQKVETICNLAESSKEWSGLNRAAFANDDDDIDDD
jgi:hypothetical protein